jgi:UDP-2,3-diacylglucosamine pyrophosphatase LpxH
MVTIIISDLHLTCRFNLRKFDYLNKVFSNADRIVINGDFWEGYLTSFDRFVKSRWNGLFPLLKSKDTVYLYGNHDPKSKSDSRVNLFSNSQGENLLIDMGKRKYHIEHGNRLAPALNERLRWLPVPKIAFFVVQQIFVHLPLLLIGKTFYMINGNRSRNGKMKIWAKKELPRNHFLICSHSHLAELSVDKNYGNTGFIKHGIGQYLKITGDTIELVDDKY